VRPEAEAALVPAPGSVPATDLDDTKAAWDEIDPAPRSGDSPPADRPAGRD
jgi:hypothetical protein